VKDEMIINLEKLKQSQATKFDDMTDFTANEIRKWLIIFASVNEEYSALDFQLEEETKKLWRRY